MNIKKAPLISFLLFIFLCFSGVYSQDKLTVPEKIRSSNIILTQDSIVWSGTMFNRTLEKKKKTFVISCAHGITNVNNIKGYRHLYKANGLFDKTVYYNCEPIYFSPKRDLSIYMLNVDSKFSSFVDNKAKLYKVGSNIYNIGAYGSIEAGGSISLGIISKIDMRIKQFPDLSFDISDCDLTGGFSGGGVFLKSNGSFIGFNVKKLNGSACVFKPLREIKEDLEKAGLDWVYNLDKSPPKINDIPKMITLPQIQVILQ